LKLGGLNFKLKFTGKLPNKREPLPYDRLVVGLDVSHPPALSARRGDADVRSNELSVVGLCTNAGKSELDFTGTYWYQEACKEMVEGDFDHRLADQVRQFMISRGKAPQSVVVFRDGVSEGQYMQVIEKEEPRIRNALFLACHENVNYKPHLTIVVVQKRSNYRVMPSRIPPNKRSATDLNLPSGTVIDDAVVNPTCTEFIMTPHNSSKGTTNPIRFTVVVDDDPRMEMKELANLSYMLCFAHGIVNGPTSLPEPVFAAHELAKRGRNNYRALRREQEMPQSRVKSEGKLNIITEEQIRNLNSHLDVCNHQALRTRKFWA